jgi:Holliday junction DNA helicase RuvB
MPKLSDMLGLEDIKRRIGVRIAARKLDGKTLPHILITGHPGCGKSTLGRAVAGEVGYLIFEREGAIWENRGQFSDWLVECCGTGAKLGKKSVLFIDEIHRMKAPIQESLYFPMLEGRVDTAQGFVELGSDFCIIGATTDKQSLKAPLLSRFPEKWDIGRYSQGLLVRIALRRFREEKIWADVDAVFEVAERSLGVPRRCLNLCDEIIDFANAKGDDSITSEHASAVFEMEGLDRIGLNPMQRKYLHVLSQGPCKIGILAAKCEQPDDLLKLEVEPVLLMLGFINVGGGGMRSMTVAGNEYVASSGD